MQTCGSASVLVMSGNMQMLSADVTGKTPMYMFRVSRVRIRTEQNIFICQNNQTFFNTQ